MNKILIIKQGALGDVIMTTPLLEPIHRHHLHDEVWILTSPAFSDVYDRWPYLKVKALPRKGLYVSLQTVFWIRHHRFNRIYDLQSSDRTAVFCFLSSAQERIGNHPRFPYNVHPKDAFTGQTHIYTRMQSVLACAGIASTVDLPSLPARPEEKERVIDWMSRHDLNTKQFAVLHAGASSRHPEKCWPYYMQIGRFLENRGIRPVWAGARDDAELNTLLSGSAGIDATGIFNIAELAQLGSRARFALTNDSGPMHVLSCSNIPVYAFFGPTNWRRNHAIGQEKNVITLQPVDVQGKVLTDPGISRLGNISVEQVINRLERDGML